MPNIVHQLIVELARVQTLLPKLGEDDQRQAQNLLRYGRQEMALNSYDGMRDALDDLSEFTPNTMPP